MVWQDPFLATQNGVPENDIIQKLVQLEITFVQQAPLAFSMW